MKTIETQRVILTILAAAILGALIGVLLISCGRASASGQSAVPFIARDGAQCYAIQNGAGETVGGNCLAR